MAGHSNELIEITEAALPLEHILSLVAAESAGGAGAVLPFIGVVRNLSQGHRVQYLEYQAYRPMALSEMKLIAGEVRKRWNVPCAIWHRIGRLEIGEASVIVAVATPHRGTAFEACRFAIDRVKETVPVWKKEVAQDGHWWVEDPLAGGPSVANIKASDAITPAAV